MATLVGSEGADVIYDTAANDEIFALGGDDVIYSGSGEDTVFASDGNDFIFAGDGNGQFLGENGNDFIETGNGNNQIFGGEGSDSVRAGAGADTIYGGAGDDDILAGAGDDLIYAGSGNTFVGAQDGNDTIYGGSGADTLNGDAGDDVIYTGTGASVIFGQTGNDRFVVDPNFGDGLQIVAGEEASDVDVLDLSNLNGVTVNFSDPETGTFSVLRGADTITASFSQIEQVILTEGADTIYGGTGDTAIDGLGGDDFIQTDTGNNTLSGGDGNDTIRAGTGGDTIYGGAGSDNILAGAGADLVYGGTENDFIGGQDGNDTLFGGAGNNTLSGDGGADFIATGDGDNQIFGGDDSDTVRAGAGADTINGGAGDDDILAGAGNDLIYAGSGNNFIGAQDGNDTIYGGTGADTLNGDAGNDIIYGLDGDDLIYAGAGSDTVSGGLGNDTFGYGAGDGLLRITDFNTGNIGTLSDGDATNNDFIDLSAFYDNIAELQDDFADDGILNQSNSGNIVWGRVVDYSDNTAFAPGDGILFDGATADGNSFTVENTGVVCFTPGTMILTERGERRIETLRQGDRIVTRDNGVQSLEWIATRKLSQADLVTAPHLRPVLVQPEVIGAQAPILVSPQHGMLIAHDTHDETLVRAIHLARLKGGKARVAHGIREVTYIHLMFSAHEIIFANGAPSESFYPGPMALAALATPARAELQELFPNLFAAPVAPIFGPRARHVVRPRDLPGHLSEIRAA